MREIERGWGGMVELVVDGERSDDGEDGSHGYGVGEEVKERKWKRKRKEKNDEEGGCEWGRENE